MPAYARPRALAGAGEVCAMTTGGRGGHADPFLAAGVLEMRKSIHRLTVKKARR